MTCYNEVDASIDGATVSSPFLNNSVVTNATGVATIGIDEELLPGDVFLVTCEADGHVDGSTLVEVGEAPISADVVNQQVSQITAGIRT